jgi:hypothetical protein
MKLGKILIAGASLIAFAAPAMAQTFNWSFDNSRLGAPDEIVSGTISGLVEGINNAHGLTINVTSTPNGEGYFGLGDGNGTFVVTNGQITYANASYWLDFGGSNLSLYLGTQPGDGTYHSQYVYIDHPSFDEFYVIWNFVSDNPAQFSVVEAPSPTPEPAAWALMVGGFGLAGTAMRRRRSATVSFG